MNKVDKLEELLLLYDPHACVITETWLNELIRDDEVVPTAYQLYRRDRGSCGGGVAVIARRGVDVQVLDQIDNHQSLFLRVTVFGITFVLLAVYRPPDTDYLYLNQLYDHAQKFNGKNVIITGDFNLPFIDWPVLSYDCSTPRDTVLDIMLALNLEQVVKVNTRGNWVLDLLFHSDFFGGGTLSVEEGISDHKLIFYSWINDTDKRKSTSVVKVIKDFARADDVAIIAYLETSPFRSDKSCGVRMTAISKCYSVLYRKLRAIKNVPSA